MTCVPVWLSVKFITSLSALNFAFFLLIPAIVKAWHGRVSKVDVLLFCFFVTATASYAVAGTPQYAFATIFVQWLSAYWVGKYLAPAAGREWTYKAIAVVTALVAIWAVVEFTLDLHVFKNLIDRSAGWNTIQSRGPFSRSEGAFGHSIAMGAFLALGLPFAFAGKFKPALRFSMVAVIIGGVLVTFSRGALLGAVVALIACAFFLPNSALSRNTRSFFIAAIAIAAISIAPTVLGLFDSLSYDTDASTAYRANLLDFIFQDMNPLGPAKNMQLAPDGRYFYRAAGSIDNAFLLTVLQFGWLPTLFLIIALISVTFRVLRKRGGPADISMVAQILVMFTVALITQYGMALWFVAGVAIAFGGQDAAEPRVEGKKTTVRQPKLPDWAKRNNAIGGSYAVEPITK
jgi:hypothetical protein